MKYFGPITSFFLISFFISLNIHSEVGDGIIFDENGLTIKMGKEPVVDHSRWNSSDGIYTLTNGTAGYVKAIKNDKGKVIAVKKVFPNFNDLHANGVFSENFVTVTTSFCNKLDSLKIDAEAKKCQNFLNDLFKLYENQGSENIFNTLKEVAKYDGVPAPAGVEAIQKSLKDQSFNMRNLESRSIIANIGYLAGRCAELKRYSEDPAEAQTTDLKQESSTLPK